MDLDNLFDTDRDNKSRHERRIKFDNEANQFLLKMEKEGFPISNLVNFCVKQCKPLYENRRFTFEGFRNLRSEIRKPY